MSLGDDLLEIVDDGRSLLGPNDLDLRPTTVTIITRRWSGGARGEGYSTDLTTLTLPNYTKVRHEKPPNEITGSGGSYEVGNITVGPITPRFVDSQGSARGFTEADLAPLVTDQAVETIYRVAGQVTGGGINGDYTRVDLQRDRRLRYMLLLVRDRTTPGPL